MVLISSSTIIRTLSLFHLTISYYLLTSPQTITEQNLVFILGESMKIPELSSLSHPSAPLSFLAIVLALFALSDLISTAALAGADSYEGGISSAYWSTQALVRCFFFFPLVGYIYLSGRSRRMGFEEELWGGEGMKTGVEMMRNRVVFTWAFVELLAWFWVYLTVRDERREAAIKIAERRRKAEEDALLKTD